MSLDEVALIAPYEGNGDVVLVNATFTWPRDDSAVPNVDGSRSSASTPKNAFTLADLTLRFPTGSLSLICGRIGERLIFPSDGISSLLTSSLQDLGNHYYLPDCSVKPIYSLARSIALDPDRMLWAIKMLKHTSRRLIGSFRIWLHMSRNKLGYRTRPSKKTSSFHLLGVQSGTSKYWKHAHYYRTSRSSKMVMTRKAINVSGLLLK